MKIFVLAALFFTTALLYASVGFGGGSTYTALLIVGGTDYRLIPVIALICNILVVSGNVWRYGREKLIDLTRIWPLIILSVPAAWFGGQLVVSETLFIGLLWIALLIAGMRLILAREILYTTDISPKTASTAVNAVIGGIIGFYSGLVGIGGGIFLAPILHFLHWGNSRQIAATCSLFILVNSLSGLLGQMNKLSSLSLLDNIWSYWPVIPAVLVGGFIGNHLGVFKLSERFLKRITGVLILIVATRLLFRWINLVSS